MPELGYALSSEEHGPLELARNAARAEETGFAFALISDHFHPWIDRQGESSFVWAAELLSEDDMAEIVACGPDPERHVEMIQRFVDAGCDHVYLHQIGPDQDGFFDFYAREVLPRFS
jgi:alkanesulfonate monooxygenase SsuD/methylene tetrahydromethanopterin reductase-like flavin-dependent oxidoreductase (luciferase family)